METALSTLTVLPMTRDEIETFVDKLANEVNAGLIDPIKLAVYLKSIEETIKAVKSHYVVSDAITDGASLYSEKKFVAFGAEITKSSRTTYNFSGCNDSIYNNLVAQQEQTKEIIKAREGVLKSGIDPATGETFQKPIPMTLEFLTIKLQ